MTPLPESFLFGAANSLHCACMCGPLALAFHARIGGAAMYHVGRVAAYTLLGVVLGSAGQALGSAQLRTPTAWIAFILAAGLLLLALVGERGALKIPGIGDALQRLLARTRGWSPQWRGLALGLATPLLPCGLLWSACAGAAVAGDGIGGAAVLGGFALGSLPLLFVAQLQAGWLQRRFGPRVLSFVQRAAMLLAAGVLVWRGALALQGSSCCH